jgi:hypothetical protein
MKMAALNIVALDVNSAAVINHKNWSILVIIETVNQSANNAHGMRISTNSQTITLTTLHDSHNHALFPADTEKYSLKYRCIPDDVLEEVQFFTEHGNLPIAVQRRLLKAKFQLYPFSIVIL